MKNNTKCIFIDNDSIYLRGLIINDLEGDYVNWFNDQEVNEHNSHHRYPMSVDKLKSYILDLNGNEHKLVLAIIRKKDHKHIGNICLDDIDFINRSANLTIIIGAKDAWGCKIGEKAGEMMLEHGFMTLNLQRIYCATSSRNKGMQKLAIKLGMVQEGVRRKAQFKGGNYDDMIEYGILISEYKS